MKIFYLFLILSTFNFSNSFGLSGDTIKLKSDSSIISKELADDDLNIFKEVTSQKVKEFEQYIVIIGDKSEPREKRDMAENEALKLFYKGAIMETSFLQNSGEVSIRSLPMQEYLYRLKVLPYLKVKIEYYDIAYINDFVKSPDGKYYATATIFQKFTGISGDNIVYTDITKKEVEIILEFYKDQFYNEHYWKIFLGNVKATETRAQ